MFGSCSNRDQSSLWAYIIAISKTAPPAIFIILHAAKHIIINFKILILKIVLYRKNKVSKHEFMFIMFGSCSSRDQSSLWAYIISISKITPPAIFPIYTQPNELSVSHVQYIYMETITKILKVVSELFVATIQLLPSILDIKWNSTIECNEPIII